MHDLGETDFPDLYWSIFNSSASIFIYKANFAAVCNLRLATCRLRNSKIKLSAPVISARMALQQKTIHGLKTGLLHRA